MGNKGIFIGDRPVGEGHPVFIMADVGANHNGDIELAKEFIYLAKDLGIDCIKFQSFIVDKLHAKRLKIDGKWVTNTKYTKNLLVEMPRWWHPILKEIADKEGVIILSTSDDIETVNMLDELGFLAHKLSSQDIIFHPLIRAMAKTNKPVIISTGLSDPTMIQEAINVCKSEGNEQIILLHCVTCYPADISDMNIRAVKTLKDIFSNFTVGLSDHTIGEDIYSVCAIGAVALGSCMIEKHITMNRKQEGIDHHFAMEPKEFEMLVKHIRAIEKAMGSGIKAPCQLEQQRFIEVTKCIRANTPIKKGQQITDDNVKIVRPGGGISPAHYEKVIGKRLIVDVQEDEEIRWDMLIQQ
ncbi:MAG: N-acetylneuraminate synthase family protein [Nitrospinae bacterium]|nr:N-acetylneuraminate synthase family protein [Nitrospinota bacterium]